MVSYRLFFLLSLFVFAFSLSNSYANSTNPEQFKFKLIDIHKGLSHNQVNCFYKDDKGFLWIGTASGLNRFDGYQMKSFFHNSRDTSSIVGNSILKLFQDPEGNLWVNTTQGYNVYNPHTDKFYRNTKEFSSKYSLPSQNVEDIFKDKDGNYWFVVVGQGITRYNPKTKTSETLKHNVSNHKSISSNYISDVTQSTNGDLWLIHRNGILERLDTRTMEIIQRTTAISERFEKELLFYSITLDSDGDLWIYLPQDSKGVFLYKTLENSFTHFTESSPTYRLNNNIVRGIVEDNHGNIWLGTDHGGINVVNKKTLEVSYILNSDCDDCLAHNSVITLFKDYDGIIWVGTYKKGANYYHENIVRFKHYKSIPSDKKSLPYNDINRFVEDDKGNLWIGTNGGGLIYYDREKEEFTQYKHNPKDPNSISSNVIVSLLVDRHKNLWIGTYYGGLNKYDGKKFTHYKYNPSNPQGLIDDNVWELYEDSTGNIWVGSIKGGVGVFNPIEETFTYYNTARRERFIYNNYIAAIMEDHQGNMWVGGNNGLDILSKKTGLIQHFQNDPLDVTSIGSNSILCLYQDKNNNIWIGTQEGLALYHHTTKTFSHFTKEDGMPDNIVLNILEDNNAGIWMSTTSGLSYLQYHYKDGKPVMSFQNYDELDGLQGKVFNENAALKTRNGELVFGGPNGFNIFNPESLIKNTKVPEIVFTDFQLFNKSVGVGKKISNRILLPQSLINTKDITLKHDENVFSIEFAAINYLHPEKNKYKYMLEGFDRDWIAADNSTRKVTYTNLDPGTYKFKVLASNNDGYWNDEGLTMNITILAPFWKTKIAYTIYVILLIILVIYIRNRMVHRTRMKFLIEQERREAKQLHELDLMKIKFFTNVSHEFRTPLALILASLEKLLKLKDVTPEKEKQYQMIGRNAKRLLSLVNQLLDLKKIEMGQMALFPSEGNIIKFLEDSVNSFSDLSDKKHIELTFTSHVKELQASFDMDKLEKIMFNLLSNAFKFTPQNGKINITVNCHENDSASEGIKVLEIKVADTGIGIPQDKLDKIFERFFQDDIPSSLVNQGSGIGLSITKEFVKIHGGSISVESEPGVGSCFTVKIPIKEEYQNSPVTSVEAGSGVKNDLPPVVAELSKNEPSKKVAPKKELPKTSTDGLPLILLVEDNDDFRHHLCDNFESYFKVIEGRNGLEGWQKALAEMPDLIVTDLMMPEMNGIDLCKKIKTDPRTSHIPVVLLTAHTADEQKINGLNIGASDYITKPFNFELLLTKIKNIITQSQKMQKAYVKKISVQTSEIDIVSLDDKLIKNAIQVVEDNLSDPDFSVEMLSRELGLSRVHLYKKMVALTGKSPVEFIRKIRIQRAAQYLEKSQLTVAEVAYKVGFNNRKYFTKYFKEEYNVLPSMYQENKEK